MNRPAALFAPAGVRLLLSRSLAADTEVRLSVAWPPEPKGRALNAQDFPEPVGGGYARQRILAGVWRPGDEESGTVFEAPMVVFRFSGPLDNGRHLVAHLVVDRVSGQLLWADQLVPPVPVDGPGELEVIPALRFRPAGTGASF